MVDFLYYFVLSLKYEFIGFFGHEESKSFVSSGVSRTQASGQMPGQHWTP